jgi:transcription elongation factor SPT5
MAPSLRGDEDLERDDDLDDYSDENLDRKCSEDELDSPSPDSKQTSSAQSGDEDEASTSGSTDKQDNQASEPRTNLDSKFFAVRTAGGQENIVANIIQNRINAKKIGIHSILILDNFKGYIIVEAPDSNIAYEALAGVRHVRGQIRGELPFKDIEGYLVKKPVVSDLGIDDTVEIIGGPFKAMKAKITRVDYEKQEATVVLLDSPYQIPVTVDANYLKKVMH